MEKKVDNTFTWVIKNFTSLQVPAIFSEQFVIGGCNWRLRLNANPEVMCLKVPDCESLPCGWRRHAKISLTIVNQFSEELSQVQETQQWADQYVPGWVFTDMLNLRARCEKDDGFLVNDEVIIVVAIDVLEVVGTLDASEKSQSMDVKGFLVLPSQVNFVNRLFEEHPDIASKFSIKNQSLKTAYKSVLLNLTETLHQSPKEISGDDLTDAKTALANMKSVGFKLDWLENRLDEIIEEKFKDLKQKCSYLEALLKKEKKDVLVARAPFSLFNNDGDLKWSWWSKSCGQTCVDQLLLVIIFFGILLVDRFS